MLNINDQLDNRYEIVSRIGQGGMSYVYCAVDKKLGREVAIKVLKEDVASNEDFVTRFKNEAKAAARLSHPNIVAVYDIVDSGELHYIVMELVEGISLKNYIQKKGVLSNKETIGIAIQTASGIAEAHRNGIIHRDVKPQNIIISRDGKIKVADFGIAVALNGDPLGNQVVMGSAHYMAPEQAKTGMADVRSDIYSFGISMYEMITGKLPFDGEDTVSIVMAHIQNALVPPRVYNHDIYPALNDIIIKAVKKDPDERYASCQELIEDLRHAVIEPEGHFVKLYNSVPSGELDQTGSKTDDGSKAEDDKIVGSTKDIGEDKSAGDKLKADSQEKDGLEAEHSGEEPQDKDSKGTAPEHKSLAENDPEDDYKAPKGWKSILLWGGFAAVILGLIIFSVTVFNSGRQHRAEISLEAGRTETDTEIAIETSESSKEESIEYTISISGEDRMPELVGKNIKDARTRMDELGITMDSSAEDYSDIYPKGFIIKQNPAVGEILSPETIVYVTVSRGSALDDLEGKREEDAAEGLENAGYTVDGLSAQDFSDTVAEGLVCGYRLVDGNGTEILPSDADTNAEIYGSQAGDMPEGSDNNNSTVPYLESGLKFGDYNIRLVISRGSINNYVQVPDLTGKTRSQAEIDLVTLGLKVGVIRALNTDQYEFGDVTSQTVAPGEYVKPGEIIDFSVSVGNTGEFADGEDITGYGDMDNQGGSGIETGGSETLLSDEYYYGSIDESCDIKGTPKGPGMINEDAVNISIRLRQHVDGADEYTQLLGPLPVTPGSKIPVTFRKIRGTYGVDKGYVEVYNADTNEVYTSFEISFEPA